MKQNRKCDDHGGVQYADNDIGGTNSTPAQLIVGWLFA